MSKGDTITLKEMAQLADIPMTSLYRLMARLEGFPPKVFITKKPVYRRQLAMDWLNRHNLIKQSPFDLAQAQQFIKRTQIQAG
jgi:predicted DNA-binding transcriptional regulator AlpA